MKSSLTSRHYYTVLPAHPRPRNQGAPRAPVYAPKELADYFGLTKGRFERLLATRSGPKPALVVRNSNGTADLTFYNRLEVASWLASIGEWSPEHD